MNLIERLKIGYAAFRGEAGVQLPAGGRSSEESLGGMMSTFLSAFGSVNPVINFEMLKTLKHLWIYNPDFSQYVANIVNLGNPGHQLTIDAKTDASAEAALNRLNESASRIYPGGCGVDGLINQYLTSIAWSGAVSSEDVVNLAARRVERVALVPVEQIRFKYNKDLGTYEPFQRSTNLRSEPGTTLGLIPLNPETYKYFALSTVENSPYAKPPATAAVEAILKGQEPIMENIQFMAQKVGLMGLVSVSVAPPSKAPGESQGEWQTKATQYLKSVKTALDGNFSKGLIVTARDQKVEHTPVTTGAQGVAELNTVSEQQVFSGMGAQPGFHGRTDSTTETFADVVYYLLTAQVGNIQRVVKRRHEQTCRLDLRLGGLDVDGISLNFNKAHSRNALAEAQTDQVQLANVLSKVRSGMLSPDDGAQELGYDNWFDVELLADRSAVVPKSLGRTFANDTTQTGRKTLTLKFSQERQKYIYQPEAIYLSSGDEVERADNVFPIKKKAQLA